MPLFREPHAQKQYSNSISIKSRLHRVKKADNFPECGYTLMMDLYRSISFSLLVVVLSWTFQASCSGVEGTSGDQGSEKESPMPLHGLHHYKIKYLGVVCGFMTLENRMESRDGKKVYHISMRAWNSPFFNKVYKIRTEIDSWVDPETLCTISYHFHSLENGKEHSESIVVEKEEVLWKTRKKEHNFKREGSEPVLDPLAFLYRLMGFANRPGSRPELVLLTTKGPMKTVAQVSGILKKKTSFGKRNLVQIRPRPVDGELFSRKGELVMWVEPGAEPDIEPVFHLLDFDLPFGHLKAILTSRSEPSSEEKSEEIPVEPDETD